MGLLDRVRRVYYFGYGAERDPNAVQAIIGARPKVIGKATIHDYELRIQNMHDIRQSAKPLARKILESAWGDSSFKSYVALPKKGSKIVGTLYRMSLRRRHILDKWELIEEGWFEKVFLPVTLESGRVVEAETQVLAPHKTASKAANGLDYPTYLLPKHVLLEKAAATRSLLH